MLTRIRANPNMFATIGGGVSLSLPLFILGRRIESPELFRMLVLLTPVAVFAGTLDSLVRRSELLSDAVSNARWLALGCVFRLSLSFI